MTLQDYGGGGEEYADTLGRCCRNTPRDPTDVAGEVWETIVRSLRVTRENPRCHSCHWVAFFYYWGERLLVGNVTIMIFPKNTT